MLISQTDWQTYQKYSSEPHNTNLFLFLAHFQVSQVAVGRRPEVSVFGTDYDTVDGTGVRDYIHIYDLAVGHVMALKKIEEGLGLKIYNLGTGRGTSVLEMIAAMEKVV